MEEYDPCSREEAESISKELWGDINSLACDAHYRAQVDIMVNGPISLTTHQRLTKEEALRWIERVYGK